MALLDVWNLRQTAHILKARCAAATAKAALDVLNEDPGTTNHANRLVWAKEALVNADTVAERMFWGILQNATIAAAGDEATDNDVQFVVNSLIDTFAGT